MTIECYQMLSIISYNTCEQTSENSQKVEEKEGVTDNAYFKYTNSGSKS